MSLDSSWVSPICSNVIIRHARDMVDDISITLQDCVNILPQQGYIGSCWLLAALRALSLRHPHQVFACIENSADCNGWYVTLFGIRVFCDDVFPFVRCADNGSPCLRAVGSQIISNGRVTVAAIFEKAFVLVVPYTNGPHRQCCLQRRNQNLIPVSRTFHYIDIHGGLVEFALQGICTSFPCICTRSFSSTLHHLPMHDWPIHAAKRHGHNRNAAAACSEHCITILYVRRGSDLHAINIDGLFLQGGNTASLKADTIIIAYDSVIGYSLCPSSHEEMYLFVSTMDGMRTGLIPVIQSNIFEQTKLRANRKPLSTSMLLQALRTTCGQVTFSWPIPKA